MKWAGMWSAGIIAASFIFALAFVFGVVMLLSPILSGAILMLLAFGVVFSLICWIGEEIYRRITGRSA